MTERVSIAVFSDVNMNIIDGSSVWTQAVCLALAEVPRVQVQLILKNTIKNDRLIGPLQDHVDIALWDPVDEQLLSGTPHMRPEDVVRALENPAFDWGAVLVRGTHAAEVLAHSDVVQGRMWAYLTDVPQHPLDVTPEVEEQFARIGQASSAVLCQTEELRSFLEMTFPQTAGKSWLLHPMIPDVIDSVTRTPPSTETLDLVYSGKYARKWNTLEMCGIPAKLRGLGIGARLSMVGDKINQDPTNREYVSSMQSALENSVGVSWRGGMSRGDSLQEMAKAHVGLSWRSPELSDSLELSTKLLEYCAVGTPPVLNRNPLHESLFGTTYPLFAESESDVVDVLKDLTSDPDTYKYLLARTREIADDFTIRRGAERLSWLVDRHFPTAIPGPKALSAIVISHDLKFFTPIAQFLDSIPNVTLQVDEWPALDRHDSERTMAMMQGADVVICEWCGPNAVFASRNKSPEQRLLVRLHRFELYSGYWRQVDIDAVDQVITVSPHYRDLTVEVTGWPASKVTVIPNYVDCELLFRPKMSRARFHLGMIGLAPSRKRFDLALQVLGELQSIDPRFMLFVKSHLPWDYPWIWRETQEKEEFFEASRSIVEAGLASNVVFDGFGADVGAWLRKIGFVLSTSDDESFHLSPAEGMASGAVPVIRPWPGADTIYNANWIKDPEEMANWIAETAFDEARWINESEAARDEIKSRYDIDSVLSKWATLLTETFQATHSTPGTAA